MDSDKRYDRAAWLGEALDVLSEQGSTKLTVRNISERLGVTTGSFYWHFKSRHDFIRAIAEYWQLVFTDAIANEVGSSSEDPREQLYTLMKILTEREIPRYDRAVRVWAAMDEDIADIVKVVDRTQMDFVGHLFLKIGFEGADLDMRTRTFVVFMNSEPGWAHDLTKSEKLKAMKLRYKWFVSR
ncbi:MAG: TetR/AcrR family transcriptional regulator [Halioglobus sp.]